MEISLKNYRKPRCSGLNQVFVSIQAKPTDVFIETVFIFAFHYFHNYQLFFFFFINANIILNKIN